MDRVEARQAGGHKFEGGTSYLAPDDGVGLLGVVVAEEEEEEVKPAPAERI